RYQADQDQPCARRAGLAQRRNGGVEQAEARGEGLLGRVGELRVLVASQQASVDLLDGGEVPRRRAGRAGRRRTASFLDRGQLQAQSLFVPLHRAQGVVRLVQRLLHAPPRRPRGERSARERRRLLLERGDLGLELQHVGVAVGELTAPLLQLLAESVEARGGAAC